MVHERCVPVVVKVACGEARGRYALPIPARVVIVACVQRLMDIANEMQQELESDQPFFDRRARRRKLGG